MSANNEVHNHAYKTTQLSLSAPATVTCSNLLGSFEECVLNGRLEPVSTVQGFTAEIAASGAFCPKRTTKPVTVFFYTLCDNDQISSPYMVCIREMIHFVCTRLLLYCDFLIRNPLQN